MADFRSSLKSITKWYEELEKVIVLKCNGWCMKKSLLNCDTQIYEAISRYDSPSPPWLALIRHRNENYGFSLPAFNLPILLPVSLQDWISKQQFGTLQTYFETMVFGDVMWPMCSGFRCTYLAVIRLLNWGTKT